MSSASAATSMNRSGLGTAGPGFFGTQEQHATLTSLPEGLAAQLPLPHQQMVSAVAAQRLPRAGDSGSTSCACPGIRRHAPRPVPAVTPPRHGRNRGRRASGATTRRTW